MITAIAIDDEPLALEVLERHAAAISFLQLQQTFTDAVMAMKYLADNKVDVLFVDIKMPDITGLELAELYRNSTQIVFTTAYPEYAVNGFDLEATDYLLKPVSLARLLQACNKVLQQQQQLRSDEVFIRDNNEWIKIVPSQVLYAEAKGNYLKVVTGSEEYMLRMTFDELNNKLESDFLRVHKSYAVNPACIDRIEYHQLTIGIVKVPVGNSYRSNMMKSLGLLR